VLYRPRERRRRPELYRGWSSGSERFVTQPGVCSLWPCTGICAAPSGPVGGGGGGAACFSGISEAERSFSYCHPPPSPLSKYWTEFSLYRFEHRKFSLDKLTSLVDFSFKLTIDAVYGVGVFVLDCSGPMAGLCLKSRCSTSVTCRISLNFRRRRRRIEQDLPIINIANLKWNE
jgi:hypothetical protein